MNDYLALGIGVVCAGAGGELFVRGVVGISRWARISPALASATLASMATSSPELTVSISAALDGTPRIALGDALGSNVVNVALVLGMAVAISAMRTSRDSVRRDFPAALAAPALTAALLLDGTLSRTDALLMLGAFSTWLAFVILEAKKQRGEPDEAGRHELRRAMVVVQSLIGLALLIAAGRLIVVGAKGIAVAFGVGEFVIAATVVAIGTGAPEIAVAVISKLRGHAEVGLGTILGSNLYNGMLVVPIAALIAPIDIEWGELSVALLFGFAAVALVFPGRDAIIGRRRGFLLLALYVLYTVVIILRRGG